MHRVLILGGDDELRRRTRDLLTDVGLGAEVTDLARIPGEIEISRILQVNQPEVVLLVVESMLSVSEFMRQLDRHSPDVPVVALSQYTDQRTVRELMHWGLKGFVPVPIVRSQFLDVIRQVFDDLRAAAHFEVIPQLFSFLPGKGGSGTSQLACHFGVALGSIAQEFGDDERVLLLDLDLASGLSRYLFERRHAYSLIEMIETGVPLGEMYWNQFVAKYDGVDVITGGRHNPRHPLTPNQVRQVIDCARGRYAAICADLTGNTESFSLEILRRSARVFLVTSSDPGAIQLATERFRFLEKLGIGRRTGLLYTRFPGQVAVSSARIAAEVGAPVLAEINFDDRKVSEAMRAGRLFDQSTSTARHIRKVAQKLVWEPATEELVVA
ncbi:hypothetical protein F183_A44700 [Bryobacterales bacterium F-183]|nr:hypothetical protein F183_A44700 [Bryobacterales bacterium F-183]